MFDAPELGVTRWGTLLVDRRMMTNLDGVFAAGDIVRGASLVGWAIRVGRHVSERMHDSPKAKAVSNAARESAAVRSEEHTPELQALMRTIDAHSCFQNKKNN